MRKSPAQLVTGARLRVRRRVRRWWHRRRDLRRETYGGSPDSGDFHTYFRPPSVDEIAPYVDSIREMAERSCEHRFDLLGSGCVQVNRDTERLDGEGAWLTRTVNASNLESSRRIWRLVSRGYVPIDWQLDFKSGHRWPQAVWYLDVPVGHRLGVDIKVPWELARMQHLPQLVWAYLLARGGFESFRAPAEYVREFQDQVLDFLATNPPRFGVNWRGTMDVAIRIANCLVAYDLFRASGVTFEADFERVFLRGTHDHGAHIVANLDWAPGSHGNHYLADVVGLLFVSAYLPRSSRVDAWLAFAVQELLGEMEHQFQPDGSNFEASTSYHRLSGEMIVYGTALVRALGPTKRRALGEYDHRLHQGPPRLDRAPASLLVREGDVERVTFPPKYIERLLRIGEFTRSITQPDGHVVQVGDNDDGRFLKLMPAFAPRASTNSPDPAATDVSRFDLTEDGLDHRHLVASLQGLLDEDRFGAFVAGREIDTALVRGLVGDPDRIDPRPQAPAGKGPGEPLLEQEGLIAGLSVESYPDFGLYVYRSARIHLAIRCGGVGQRGRGGHAHNDNLSVILALDGIPILVDPGTYLYTPDPEQRNRFRSTAMHNTMRPQGQEQNTWREGWAGLFSMQHKAHATAEHVRPTRFEGTHQGFGVPCTRIISLDGRRIEGVDRLACAGTKIVAFHLAPGRTARLSATAGAIEIPLRTGRLRLLTSAGDWSLRDENYSPGYGRIEPSTVLEIRADEDEIRWSIEVPDPDRT